MRHFIIAPLSLVALLPLAALLAAQQSPPNPACPAPSVSQGAECVLRGDAILRDTMWIQSGTKLNCQGHTLTPRTSGTLDQPRSLENEFQPSQPELALFVHRSYDVQIQNCRITGFDFGIFVAQSKAADAPSGFQNTNTRILNNAIDVRTNAIDVIKSDGVIISDNRLIYASERGRGVVLEFDSDNNEILRNAIVSTDAASTGLVRQVPGGPFVTLPAIMDNEIHSLQMNQPVRNLVVSGILTQIATSDPSVPIEDSGRPDNNVIEANDIWDVGVGPSCTFDPGTLCSSNDDCSGAGHGNVCLLKQNAGIAFNLRSADSSVLGNRFSGQMNRGISFAGVGTAILIPGWFHGACALDRRRICSTDADCSIPGYDVSDIGLCDGEAPLTLNGNSIGLTAEDNRLSGVYDTAALIAADTDRFIFRGNTVEGGVSGIRINPPAINGVIERNVVSGSGNALFLALSLAIPPSVHVIRLNDFTGYSVAIRTTNDFTVARDISVDTGNYWGLPCPGFNRKRVLFDNGSVNPRVVDGKPYGQPVARTSPGNLPVPCQ